MHLIYHSSHGNDLLKVHISSDVQDGAIRLLSAVEHWRNKKRREETEIAGMAEEEEKGGTEGDGQPVDRGEDDEEDENNGRDSNEHNEEPLTRLNGAIRKKESSRSIQRKESELRMRGREKKAISSA
jgi:hypothetical protein